MKRLLWLLPLFLVEILSAAPSISSQGMAVLSAFLKNATDRRDVPGAVVAVVNRDDVVYHEAFGLSSILTKRAMSKDTIFNMASMTKPVTSVAIMMLVDEGKLTLDDDVAKFLPKYKNPVVITRFNASDASYATRPATRPITIRHLLTHTSGLQYALTSAMLTKLTQKTGKTEVDLPLVFNPGERWAYGPSTRVLGDVVEVVSGEKLDVFLESHILRPLGMRDTAYVVPKTKYSRVVGLNRRGEDGQFVEAPMPDTLPVTVAGDAGLYGTAGDYALFLQMLLNRGKLGDTRILSEKSAGTMFENNSGDVVVGEQQSINQSFSRSFPVGVGKDHWGLGFQLAAEQVPNRRTVGSGSWAGAFNTHFF